MSKKRMMFLCLLLVFFTFEFSMAAEKILFSSTFTGAEGKRPAEWKIDSAPDIGYWFIQDGQLSSGNGDDLEATYTPDGYSFAILNSDGASGWTNYSVECSVWSLQENGYILLVGRWTDRANYYAGVIETNNGKRILRVERIQNGNRVVLGMVEHGKENVDIPKIERGLSSADAKTLKMNFYNNQISLEFDRKLYISVNDDALKSGAPGVGQWYNNVYFDNFVVTELTSPLAGQSKSAAGTGEKSSIRIEQKSASTGELLSAKVYRISMGSNLTQNLADTLKNQLINWGYTPVELIQKGDKYEVVLGAFLSENEAKSAKDVLANEGLNPGSIIAESGKTAEKAMQKASEPASASLSAYRVLVKSFPSRQGANMLKDALENDGYYPVDVIEAEGKFFVYIGRFNAKADADKLAGDLVNDGYPFASAQEEKKTGSSTTVASIPSQPAPFQTKDDIIKTIQEQKPTLKEPEVKTVASIIDAQQKAKAGMLDSAQYQQLLTDYKRLDENLKSLITSIKKKDEDEKQMKVKISQLGLEIDRAIDQKNLNEAEVKLAELKQIDQTNTIIPLKERRLKQLKEGGLDNVQDLIRQEIETARKAAKEFEDEANIPSAILQWKVIQQKAASNSVDFQQAGEQIGRLKALQAEAKDKEVKEAKKQQYLIYGIAGLVVLLILVAILFMIRTRKRDRELLKQVQELTIKPLMEIAEGKAPKELLDLRGDEERIPSIKGKKQPVVEESPEEEEEEVAPPPQKKPAKEQPKDKKKAKTPVTPPAPVAEAELEKEPDLAFPSSLSGMFDEPPAPKKEPPKPPIESPKQETKKASKPEVVRIPEPEPVEPEPEPVSAQPEPVILTNSFNLADDTAVLNPTSKKESEPLIEAPSVDVDDLIFGGDEKKEDEIISIKANDDIFSIKPESSSPFTSSESPIQIEPANIFSNADTQAKSEPVLPVIEISKPEPAPAVEEKKKTDEIKVPNVIFAQAPPTPPVSAPIPKTESKPVEKTEKPPVSEPITQSQIQEIGEDTIYVQDFDNETQGEKPQNWKGDYDFSSLLVSNETPAANSTKYMKFEKKLGSGSAYYSCRFNDASGVVCVEFDLRCDNKNKYLLGFYIEKDEDFRQSIHTIIHRTDSNSEPSLRIQGQPTPYKLGEWCRIKYIISLIEGTVDGYVNEKLVANRIRLATRPKNLNTLSIRDNLATTGILLIDNIKIYRI